MKNIFLSFFDVHLPPDTRPQKSFQEGIKRRFAYPLQIADDATQILRSLQKTLCPFCA